MSYIDLTSSAYSNLSQFGVLASGALNSTGVIDVDNGYYYGSSGDYTSLNGVGYPSGFNDTISTSALSQLSNLIIEIIGVTDTLPRINIGTGGGDLTISPGVNYLGTAGANIAFTGQTITFDAAGDSNAQFFIASSGVSATDALTFTSTIFKLKPDGSSGPEAKPCNIFWLVKDGGFTATDSSVPGIIITDADFTTTSDAAPDISFTGHIYSQGAATFTRSGAGTLTINSSTCAYSPEPNPVPNPISAICFLGDTPILTDQGIIAISEIDPEVNTIREEKILAITKTTTLDEYLVCFEQDAFGLGVPSKKTVMSKDHKVYCNGNMIEARRFINKFANVNTVDYCGQVLYNIVMEKHSIINVNNLICETLHPENMIAKLYTNQTLKYKNAFIAQMNKDILKKHALNKKLTK